MKRYMSGRSEPAASGTLETGGEPTTGQRGSLGAEVTILRCTCVFATLGCCFLCY
jgi:hypothetical protein